MTSPVTSPVTIVETGVANVASVTAAFARLGVEVVRTSDARAVADAERLVLPGVGAFGAGMARLRADGLDRVLAERVAGGRPTLAICLGLQLLCRGSQETPGVTGLGVLDVEVTRFEGTVRIPQFGWNRVEPDSGCTLTRPGFAYFANAYRITGTPAGWSAGRADHGGPFVATLERGAVLACQCHPELSGAWGRGLLERWLVRTEERVPC